MQLHVRCAAAVDPRRLTFLRNTPKRRLQAAKSKYGSIFMALSLPGAQSVRNPRRYRRQSASGRATPEWGGSTFLQCTLPSTLGSFSDDAVDRPNGEVASFPSLAARAMRRALLVNRCTAGCGTRFLQKKTRRLSRHCTKAQRLPKLLVL